MNFKNIFKGFKWPSGIIYLVLFFIYMSYEMGRHNMKLQFVSHMKDVCSVIEGIPYKDFEKFFVVSNSTIDTDYEKLIEYRERKIKKLKILMDSGSIEGDYLIDVAEAISEIRAMSYCVERHNRAVERGKRYSNLYKEGKD